MATDSLLGMMSNLGLLSFGSLMLCIALRRREKCYACKASVTGQAFLGAMLGGLSLLVVQAPIPMPFGASVDTRAAPLFIAGYLCGPVGAAAAALIGGAARYNIGGPAVVGGVLSVVIYAMCGLAARKLTTLAGRKSLGLNGWIGAAVAITIAVCPAFLINRPLNVGLALLETVWPIVLLGNTAGMVVMGLLTERFLRSEPCADHGGDRVERRSP